jgi:serine protease Do
MPQRSLPYLLGAAVGLAVGLGILLAWILGGSDAVPPERIAEVAPVPRQLVEEDLDPDSRITQERRNAIVEATRRVSPAVVSISTLRRHPAVRLDPNDLWNLFFRREPSNVVGLGSGFVVDHRGYILTTHHVISDSRELVVTLRDGQRFDAEVVGTSPEFDLALIKLQGEVSGLPTIPLGNSDELENGEWAIAIGSPFGYLLEDSQPTVTVGVISALHRDVKGNRGPVYYDMIQTDAAINPGNSGGPLLNSRGEVIGINTTVISDAGGRATGLGFAIPIERGRWVMDEIFEHGRVRQAYHGIDGYFLTPDVRAELLVPRNWPDGCLVWSIAEGSPADEAGILPRDVITAVGGRDFFDPRAGRRFLYESRVGRTFEMTIWRQGRSFDVDLTLAERPSSTDAP